tara:strand:- start:3142 stop:4809 length:1668 start_codon:yes stop_codon:yes gene_type:complete
MSTKSKVLALKYRPQTFGQLIGQEVVAETIVNSIKADKVPNAYLLTGIRGVGKTTTARIIAKALNCSKGIDNLCEDKFCENCDPIINSSHIDVMEVDAASHTGIDNIREMIDLSRYAPTTAKYKIFIIDETHMLSKQAFAGLLKTLEEPPQYKNGGGLKFIFATTEVKKIPVTIVSRCQRFDLSRIKSSQLFEFIKKIKDKEKGKVSDDALKLIVKISEGSVRDALSLLDRALLSKEKDKELDLNSAQKIFGYFDKSQLIDLFELVLNGEEIKAIEIYRKIYDQGIEPKIFLNDFLELVYYFKNINSLSMESTNFALNDSEFSKIKKIAYEISNQTLLLFWQFTLKTLEELDIVNNQNLSIEMFLIRLMHLKSFKTKEHHTLMEEQIDKSINKNEKIILDAEIKSETISQIKNISQEEKVKIEDEKKIKAEDRITINSFDQLLKICNEQKEIKLKYELEKNVNLVRFENNQIEISFNDNLEKNFVKDLSLKLFEWTGERWIITFSKIKGELSIKDKEKNKRIENINNAKQSRLYKNVIEKFPDADLIDINLKKEN